MKRKDIPSVEVIKACQERKVTNEFLTDILMRKFNAPEKLVYSALERDSDYGLIEYGVSIRTAWATDRGLKLLNQ